KRFDYRFITAIRRKHLVRLPGRRVNWPRMYGSLPRYQQQNSEDNMISQISRLHSAVPIRRSQVVPLGTLLTRAYYNDPGVTYVLPDPDVRSAVLSWFFTSVALQASQLCGEIYTTVNVDGDALWICPGANLTIGHVLRTEISSLPQTLDRSTVARWIT